MNRHFHPFVDRRDRDLEETFPSPVCVLDGVRARLPGRHQEVVDLLRRCVDFPEPATDRVAKRGEYARLRRQPERQGVSREGNGTQRE